MNILLFHADEKTADNRLVITGRRAEHIRGILKSEIDDELQVGELNGQLGTARIIAFPSEGVELEIQLDREPPLPNPAILVLALPRPIVLSRLLRSVTTLGVKDIHLIHSRRVEKSYWSSPVLSEDHMGEQLTLGLEQAKDTVMPRVQLHRRFKPFVEDQLPALAEKRSCYLAHPSATDDNSVVSNEPAVLAIGPEGGWIDFELDQFVDRGFQMMSLGQRILKVETAVSVALAPWVRG